MQQSHAQRWLDEVTTAVVTGVYVDPRAGALTFEAWCAEWASRQVWARGTLTAAEKAVRSTTFRGLQLRTIRPSHVQAWIKAMTDGTRPIAASTVRMRYNYVHMAFRAAVRDRLIPHDPSEDVRLPRRRRADMAMTIPNVEQVAAALDAAPAHFRAFVAVCAFAGLRLGEAAGLQVADIDFLRRTITVSRQVVGDNARSSEVTPPKHGSERVVAIPSELTEILSQHVDVNGIRGDEGWLFWSGRDLLNRGSAGHLWRRTRAAVGMDNFTLHSLRHFYASALIAAGCDVVTVQRALGHSSAAFTLGVYSHLWPKAEDRTRAATADLMRDVLGRPADSRRTGDTGRAAD